MLLDFYRARYGPARGFRLRDPFDHASAGMGEAVSPTDQLVAVADGLADTFDLVKTYGSQQRRITRPVEGTIMVAVDNVAASGWVHLGGGRIRFNSAPPAGARITAGYLFDVPVRFAEDRIDISGVSFAAGEAPSVALVEIREET